MGRAGPAAGGASPAEQFRDIVDHVADAIVVVDDAGTVLFANPAARQLLRRDDLVGSSFGAALPAADGSEIDVVGPAGDSRVAELRVRELTWEDRPAHVVAMRDVTERHRTERTLRDFVSMVSHELRTPLATTRSTLELLRAQPQGVSAPTHEELLDAIGRQVDRMLRITGDLLVVARLDDDRVDLELGSVAVGAVARSTAEELAPDGQVQVAVPEGTLVVADAQRLRQILDNYVANALRHGRPPVTIAAERDGDAVVIRVCDDGDGVPSWFVPHLFERFSRARVDDGPAGTGLGLAIVETLATLQGGECWYEPRRPHGACFCVRLPAGEPATGLRG